MSIVWSAITAVLLSGASIALGFADKANLAVVFGLAAITAAQLSNREK